MVSRIFKPIHPSPIHALAALALTLVCTPVNGAVTTAQGLTCADMEEFLKFGKIGVQKSIPKGVTLPRRATLEYKGCNTTPRFKPLIFLGRSSEPQPPLS